MKLRTYGYFFKQAFKSIFRNGWMSAASIATVSVSLIILGAFVLVVANTNYIASQIESDVEIAAYLEVETPEEETEYIRETISDLAGVSQVELVTKEEGLKQLNEQFGKDHDLIAAMGGENPLPDYILVRAEDPEKVPVLAQKIETLDYIESVDYGQGVVERLFSLTNWIRVGGLVTIILLAVATVFLIAITIRITIFARKKEIEIMQCVGATRWFIRCPFFLEGMFLGFTGSLIACITLYFSYLFLIDKINSALSFLPVVTDLNLLLGILLIVLVAGPFVGAIGSMLSLRRFLQV
jgi:cell division transport system permease protein